MTGDRCDSCPSGSCSSDPGDRLPPGMLSVYDLNASVADGVLVWIEVTDGGIHEDVLRILGKAKALSMGRTFGVIFGGVSRKEHYAKAFEYGVDTIYHIRSSELDTFHPEAYTDAVREVSERIVPAAILMSATPRGAELAPRVAASLNAGMVSCCTDLELIDGRLLMTHPVPDGTVTAECVTFPQMATVAPGTFPMPVPETGRKGTAINRPFSAAIKKIISDNH